MNLERLKSFLEEKQFVCVSSYCHTEFDDTLNEREFKDHVSKNNSDKYVVDRIRIETYQNKSGDILIQFSTKEYSQKINDEHRKILEINNSEISFVEHLRSECEKLSTEMITKCYQRASQFIDEDSPIIGIIGSTPDGMYVKEYNLGKGAKNLSAEELDLHYGEDFHTFHEKLSSLLKTDSKGLIIFHGEPGTGKTYYIRMLLKDLVKSKKNVLYVPSNFIDSFLDPNFITFLSDWILEQNNPTIILLEDAETLVESRDSGVRSLGISNLLNITDGILNDILGTQIILTFNTNLDYIDSALLRPERLLARKEFTNLTVDESNKLIRHLGIDSETSIEMSLADIYSMKNQRQVLYHNIKQKKSKVGFVI
jgi:Cdc6-like AAA superfamily ATPase